MTLNHYDIELQQLAATYRAAMSEDVTRLKTAIASASECSVIGVGSGGSYTIASLLCSLHEAYTGRVSRPSTPLEIICNPTLAASSPVFLISAEGKNPDIIEALQRARRHSPRAVHVLTNRVNCPLMHKVNQLTGVSSHTFELTKKDGYLATNSLLLDAVLIARAYGELNQASDNLPMELSQLRIGIRSLDEWADHSREFVRSCVSRGTITVIYSPLLKPIADDLESKLSEAALLHTQLADLRSYAHGRHLWLANRPQECTVLALTEPSLDRLWDQMRALFPGDVPTLTMNLAGAAPRELIAGLIAQMYLVSAISNGLGQDPAQPVVPQFGRDLYYLNLQDAIPAPTEEDNDMERSKYEVLGARWPSSRSSGPMRRAKNEYLDDLERQRFRSVVFDYDGTLCSSHRNSGQLSKIVLQHLERLVRSGVIVGIASGRGGSVQETLQTSLSADLLARIQLGLYNGGSITDAATGPVKEQEPSEFLSHVTRIIVRLRALGVPIDDFKTTHPYQVSVRFREGLPTDNMWFVIADALRQAGLDLSSMVKSKHSIDILATGITKSRLIAHIIQKFKIDPYEILTLGDQGAWPGNDSALLEHRFSLSVDVPSRRLDRGWNLAPPHRRDVDATIWYLEHFVEYGVGEFSVRLRQPVSSELPDHA